MGGDPALILATRPLTEANEAVFTPLPRPGERSGRPQTHPMSPPRAPQEGPGISPQQALGGSTRREVPWERVPASRAQSPLPGAGGTGGGGVPRRRAGPRPAHRALETAVLPVHAASGEPHVGFLRRKQSRTLQSGRLGAFLPFPHGCPRFWRNSQKAETAIPGGRPTDPTCSPRVGPAPPRPAHRPLLRTRHPRKKGGSQLRGPGPAPAASGPTLRPRRHPDADSKQGPGEQKRAGAPGHGSEGAASTPPRLRRASCAVEQGRGLSLLLKARAPQNLRPLAERTLRVRCPADRRLWPAGVGAAARCMG